MTTPGYMSMGTVVTGPQWNDRSWGQQDRLRRVNPDGSPGAQIIGTSGAEQDATRYLMMGDKRTGAPLINEARSNEIRDLQMGGLAGLQSRAAGENTHALDLARLQHKGSINALRSGAASIKGGAMARAAAARSAQSQIAQVTAQGRQDREALRAREMADAAGTYAGATTTLRGTDLGIATDQSKLNMGNLASNQQRELNYENMAWKTKNAQMGAELGYTAADQNAANVNRAQSLAEDQANLGYAKDVASTVGGGANGALTGYMSSQGTAPTGPHRKGLSTYDDPYR